MSNLTVMYSVPGIVVACKRARTCMRRASLSNGVRRALPRAQLVNGRMDGRTGWRAGGREGPSKTHAGLESGEFDWSRSFFDRTRWRARIGCNNCRRWTRAVRPRPPSGSSCTACSGGCTCTPCTWPAPSTGGPSTSRPSTRCTSSCGTCSPCGRWWVESIVVLHRGQCSTLGDSRARTIEASVVSVGGVRLG